jgi:signal transduction histidine kinase
VNAGRSIPSALTVLGAAATVTVAYIAVVEQDPALSATGGSAVAVTLIAAGVAVSAVAGAWGSQPLSPGRAWGVAIAATGALLPLWAAWTVWPPWLRSAALSTGSLTVLGVTLGALHARPLGSFLERHALGIVAVLSIAAVMFHLAGYNPFDDRGCRLTCLDSPPVGSGVLNVGQAVAVSCLLAEIAAGVALTALLVGSRRSRTPNPLHMAGAGSLLCGAASTAWRWVTWEWGKSFTGALLLQAVGVGAFLIALCVVRVRALRLRAAVSLLASTLSEATGEAVPRFGQVRGAWFAVPVEHRWVDSTGQDVAGDVDPSPHVLLRDHSGPTVMLLLTVHADPAEVLASVTPAVRLMLANVRLTALAMARLHDVRDTQRRIVTAADAERVRIERDLHDGVQQQVVGTAFHLRALAGQADQVTAEHLIRAEVHLRSALVHLRGLAQGPFPDALFEEGLAAALDELAETADAHLTCDLRMPAALTPQIATAAYAMIMTAVEAGEGQPPATHVSVSVVGDAQLTIDVQVLGRSTLRPPDFTDVGDRVGAIGGTFTLKLETGSYSARAVIPYS